MQDVELDALATCDVATGDVKGEVVVERDALAMKVG